MVQKVIDSVFSGKKFLCIEVCMREGGATYHVLEVVQKKTALFIASATQYDSFDDLVEAIPKNQTTLLSFSGQGIISKKLPKTAEYRAQMLFNADPGEFYWYELEEPESMFASVVRKTTVDEVIRAFEAQQILVVDISIGPFVLHSVKPLLPQTSQIKNGNFQLDFNGDVLADFSKNDGTYEAEGYHIEGEQIPAKGITGFATLLRYLFPNDKIDLEADVLNGNREAFKYRKAFNTIGMIAMPIFFVALLVSYLLLGHYQNAYVDVQVVLEEENIAYNKLKLLEEDRKNKEAMLTESGLNDSNFLSYYISEITADIPSEVNLNSLGVFMPTVKVKSGEKIIFANDEIKITGTTSSNEAFAEWIKAVKSFTWINKLEIVDFRKNGRTSDFEIRLKLMFHV